MKLLLPLLFLLCATLSHAATATPTPTPPAKEIESLLAYVGGLDGAVFIRNGSEHTAKDAAAHLRTKWEQQKDQVHTAEDFITLCAAKSSLSGTPYEIRLKDGKKLPAETLLRAELLRLRAPKSPPT